MPSASVADSAGLVSAAPPDAEVPAVLLLLPQPASAEAVIAAISSVPTNFFLILNPPLKQYIIC